MGSGASSENSGQKTNFRFALRHRIVSQASPIRLKDSSGGRQKSWTRRLSAGKGNSRRLIPINGEEDSTVIQAPIVQSGDASACETSPRNVSGEGLQTINALTPRRLTHQGELTDFSSQLQQLFREFDSAGTGYLELKDIGPAALKLGFSLSDAQCMELFEQLDVDHDQKVQPDEFVAYFQSMESVSKDIMAIADHRVSIRVVECLPSFNLDIPVIDELDAIEEEEIDDVFPQEEKKRQDSKSSFQVASSSDTPTQRSTHTPSFTLEHRPTFTARRSSLQLLPVNHEETMTGTIPDTSITHVPDQESASSVEEDLDPRHLNTWSANQVLQWLRLNLKKKTDDLAAPAWQERQITGMRLLQLTKEDMSAPCFQRPGKTGNAIPGFLWAKIASLQKLFNAPVEEFAFPPNTVIMDTNTQSELCIVDQFLGRGQYGEVYQVQWRSGGVRGINAGSTVAMKTIRFKDIPQSRRDEYRILLIDEILTSLRITPHANVVNVVNANIMHFCLPQEEYLCFEDMIYGKDLEVEIGEGKGDLYKGTRPVVQNRVLRYAIEMAWGLHHIHTCRVLHQDIKSANVMVGFSSHQYNQSSDLNRKEKCCFVADFGLAVIGNFEASLHTDERSSEPGRNSESFGTLIGRLNGFTQSHRSPEVARILEDRNAALTPRARSRALHGFTHRSDMWSLGLVFLEMYTGGVTWTHGERALDILEQRNFRISMPERVFALLKNIFHEDSSKRPASCEEVAFKLEDCYELLTGEKFPRPETRHGVPLDGAKIGRLHVWLGKALYMKGRIADAIREYAEGVRVLSETETERHSESMAMFRNMLGKALYQQKELHESVKHLEEAAALCPEKVQYRIDAAKVLQEVGNLDKARHHLERALALCPSDVLAPQVHFRIGNILREMLHHEAALKHFQRASELQPENKLFSTTLCSVSSRVTQLHRAEEERQSAKSATFRARQQIKKINANDATTYKIMRFVGKGELYGLPSSELYVVQKVKDEYCETLNMLYMQFPARPDSGLAMPHKRGWDYSGNFSNSSEFPSGHRNSVTGLMPLSITPRTKESLQQIQCASESLFIPEQKSSKMSLDQHVRRKTVFDKPSTVQTSPTPSRPKSSAGSAPQNSKNKLQGAIRERVMAQTAVKGLRHNSLKSPTTQRHEFLSQVSDSSAGSHLLNKKTAKKYEVEANTPDRTEMPSHDPLKSSAGRRRRRSYGAEEYERHLKQREEHFQTILTGIGNWSLLSACIHSNLVNLRDFLGGYTDIMLLTDKFSEASDIPSTLSNAMKTSLYSGTHKEVIGKLLGISLQLADALVCLHQQGIMFQSLSPSAVEIIELGDSCIIRLRPDLLHIRQQIGNTQPMECVYSGGTPPTYRSPEIAMGADTVTPATCDIWAWALIVLELFSGQIWATGEGENAQTALEDFKSRPQLVESWTPEEVLEWLHSLQVVGPDIDSQIVAQNVTGEKLLGITCHRDIVMKIGIMDHNLSSQIWDAISVKSKRFFIPDELLGILEKCFQRDASQRFLEMSEITDILKSMLPDWSTDSFEVCPCRDAASQDPETITQGRQGVSSLLNNLGIAFWQREQTNEATDYFKLALQYDANAHETHFNLGRLYEGMHNVEVAFQHLTTAFNLLDEKHPYYEKFASEIRDTQRRKGHAGHNRKKNLPLPASNTAHQKNMFQNKNGFQVKSSQFWPYMRR